MEYLHECLATLKLNPVFDFHPRCQQLSIFHLYFMDDFLLCATDDVLSISLLNDIFTHFSEASGLKSNLANSHVYFGGVPLQDRDAILTVLGYKVGELPFKYLGVTLSTKRLTVKQCQPLIEKITSRITT